nr:B-cell lymphoma 3 protein [Vulpes vulpes]
MGSLFPLLNLPTPLYSMVYSMEHPLSADIAVATHADEDGDTPLHIAVVQGNLPAVHRLVNLFQHGGRELDIYNNLRQTPLHLAVITTLPSMVRLLVMAGASPMALDRHGQTAAHLACEHRSPTCLRALLDSAAPGTVDLEARNYDGLTALHVAVNMQCPEAVLLLLERGADIDAVDIKSGRSPLIHAVENNSLSMVQLLLQASLCQPSDFSPEAALLAGAFSLAFPRPQNEPGPAATTALLTLPPALSFRPPRLWTFPSSEGPPLGRAGTGAERPRPAPGGQPGPWLPAFRHPPRSCTRRGPGLGGGSEPPWSRPVVTPISLQVIDILRGKATRPAPASQPEPSPERSATTSPESSSLLSSNGLLSASPSSSPSQSPPKDPPGFPMAPPSFFLPPSSPPAFLPFAGVLRAPGRPVPPSPAPGGS